MSFIFRTLNDVGIYQEAEICMSDHLNESCNARCYKPKKGFNIIDMDAAFGHRVTSMMVFEFAQKKGISEFQDVHIFSELKVDVFGEDAKCVDPTMQGVCVCLDGYASSNGGNVVKYDTCLRCVNTNSF